ncbi:MAG: flagellar export apparatus protein FliQ [Gemmatimonadota bacterium]|nr:MAG: flagellar export apparatus protein FliQ [Gemmatimonadota bacterium]
MTPESALDMFREALFTALMLASPMLGVGLVIGLTVSIFQAVTSIQEMTLTFIPKMIGVILAVIIALPWMLRFMIGYTTTLFSSLGMAH